MTALQLGWIGLGSMGIGMAKNLQAHLSATASPNLLFTNRTISRGDVLKNIGAIPVITVAELAKKSDIIFSCVRYFTEEIENTYKNTNYISR